MEFLINYEPVIFGNLKILPVIQQDGIDKGNVELIIRPVASNRIEIFSR